MREKLKPLYELQQLDLQLAKAQKAKASLDDGSSKRQQVEAARAEVEKAEKLLHEATTEMHDKDLDLKTVEAKQKSFRDKLYGGTVSNPKELDSMEKEVEMLGRQKDKLEERILELLDTVEEHKSSLAAAQAALKRQEDECAAYMQKLRDDDAALDARIRELSASREKALPSVDSALLKRYTSMKAHAGGVVVAKLEDGHCSACHTQMTSGFIRTVQADQELQTCDNCGRMLYWEP
ncbi:MAG: C4-type zinc ribbon domain-containing protein [Armatimonadetes bacterium]|nr:C4-type zinc ribbon domain-containing protein [Armatimonadota bacterium]